MVEVYRIGRGGGELGERVVVGEGPVEVRVVGGRDYYEERVGCMFRSPAACLQRGDV